MYKNELLPNTVKYSAFHTSITKGIKEGEKKERKKARKGGKIGQYKACIICQIFVSKLPLLRCNLSLDKRRRVSSAMRLDGPYAKRPGMVRVGAGGISWCQRKMNSSQMRVSKGL